MMRSKWTPNQAVYSGKKSPEDHDERSNKLYMLAAVSLDPDPSILDPDSKSNNLLGSDSFCGPRSGVVQEIDNSSCPMQWGQDVMTHSNLTQEASAGSLIQLQMSDNLMGKRPLDEDKIFADWIRSQAEQDGDQEPLVTGPFKGKCRFSHERSTRQQ